MTFDAIDQNGGQHYSFAFDRGHSSAILDRSMGAAPMAYVLWNHVMNVNQRLAVTGGKAVTVLFFLQSHGSAFAIISCTFQAMMYQWMI